MQLDRRLLLVGGGHAHALALTTLAKTLPSGVRVTLLSEARSAVYSGMVPGVIEGRYRAGEAEIDLASLAAHAGATFTQGRAVHIDPGARVVRLEDGGALPYDVASFDIGSTVAGLDMPGVKEHALPTRPIDRLVRVVTRTVDHARLSGDTYRVVVVGGGAGGVELAFTLRHRLAGRAVPAHVTLVHSGPEVLAGSPRGLARRGHASAEGSGLRIRPASRVEEVTKGAVRLAGGEAIEAYAVIWAAGAAAHPLFSESGIATDDQGFALTRDTLQLHSHDELFASGDCAALVNYPGTPKAGVYAVRQAPVLAANLAACLRSGPLTAYRPQADFLALLNLGGGYAVGSRSGISFGGRWVMALKDRIDRRFMQGLQR